MSSARSYRREGKEFDADDDRNLLASVVASVALALLPRVIVLENVPQFLTRVVKKDESGSVTAPQLLVEKLGHLYQCFAITTDLADYGVPQRRRRTFVTLVHKEEPALAALAEIGAVPFPTVTRSEERRVFSSVTQGLAPLSCTVDGATSDDPLHCVPIWKDRQRRMVEATPSEGGSAWLNQACESGCHLSDVPAEAAVCPSCGEPMLRPVVRDKKTGEVRLVRGFQTSYSRQRSSEPSATITTASGHVGSDVTLHPTEHRVLSVRECARLQTIDDEFKWGDALTHWGVGKVREMIGEAIPPHFTKQHGEVLKAILGGTEGVSEQTMMMRDDDSRLALAMPKLFSRKAAEPDLFADA